MPGGLTAFDIEETGKSERSPTLGRTYPSGAVPDGICLDSGGGIWSASPTTSECIRQDEGGAVTHRVALDQGAFACMLGGTGGPIPRRDTACSFSPPLSSEPEACRRDRSGKIEVCRAPFGGAGLP